MGYGRPMKGASRRIPVTVHLTVGALDIIDNYIDDHEKGVEKGRMSRSDFINEAVNAYLVELGLMEAPQADGGNTLVTGKPEANENQGNTGNTGTEKTVK